MHVVTLNTVTLVQHLTNSVTCMGVTYMTVFAKRVGILYSSKKQTQNSLRNKDVQTYKHKIEKVNQNVQSYSQMIIHTYLWLS